MKIYLETTLFNYFFDSERDGHADTVRLFEEIGKHNFEGYTSEYVTFELQKAVEPKRSDMLALIKKYGIITLDFEDEAIRLANLYVENKIIPQRYLLDGAHIGIASFHNLDCILSFNFQHINKPKTKEMTAFVNLREGCKVKSDAHFLQSRGQPCGLRRTAALLMSITLIPQTPFMAAGCKHLGPPAYFTTTFTDAVMAGQTASCRPYCICDGFAQGCL